MKKISICIPAYKKPGNLRRLLGSIRSQSFTDYEIIITDDSPDDSVEKVLPEYSSLPIIYYKNIPALGTPANWNFGISKAGGEWIKIMHDDDWFAHKDSLAKYADQTKKGKKIILARYSNVFTSGEIKQPAFPPSWRKKILDEPMLLLANNVIGPPSVTMVHRTVNELYDNRMKWRVDMDLYIRLLSIYKDFSLVDEPLVNVGISETQVTNDCINEPGVELPEGWLLLDKYGTSHLKNILVYDAWWRILRNVNIRDPKQLPAFSNGRPWPEVINRMVRQQSSIPASVLKNGFVSKPAMALSFIRNLRYIKT